MESKDPGYFAHAQDDLSLHILRMFKGSTSFGEAQIIWKADNVEKQNIKRKQ